MKGFFIAVLIAILIFILLLKFNFITLTPQSKEMIQKSESSITKSAKDFARKQVNKASEALKE